MDHLRRDTGASRPILRLLAALVPALIVVAGGAVGQAPLEVTRIERVMAGLLPAVHVRGRAPVRYAIEPRMAHYNTPGASIAVVNDGRIEWARGVGMTETAGTDPVTPATLFQAGSISKPVAATATLRLVEQRRLSLDENVNRYLRTWKLPENEFTAREPVTLRRILSHTAGLTVHGFPGYAVTSRMPTLPQILDGQPPANTPPVRVDVVPGSMMRYSGGGTTVQQLLVTDVTRRPFPALLQELVFAPLGMRDSTFEQPLPATRAPHASAAHRSDGTMVPGRSHVYPEMAAAGLWTTPTDLLIWAIDIAAAWNGQTATLLSHAMAREMLTPLGGPVGLGPFVSGSGRSFRFGHSGADEGFHAELVYFPETGQGAAVMVNSDGGPPMIREILYAIAAEYDWPDYGPRVVDSVAPPAGLDQLPGVYEMTTPRAVAMTIARERDRVFLTAPRLGWHSEAVFVTPERLVLLENGTEFGFVRDRGGDVIALSFGAVTVPRRADVSRR